MRRVSLSRQRFGTWLWVGGGLLVLGLMFWTVGRLDGELDKKDLLDFIEAVIVSVSFGIALALAVLAINAFKNFREIEAFKEEADQLRASLSQKMVHVDQMLGALPAAIETISARLSEISPREEGERDTGYFRLLHVRLFLKLLMATDPIAKIDICRDIIGSMSPEDSAQILDQTMAILRELRQERPKDRDLIDPLIKTGDIVAQQQKASHPTEELEAPTAVPGVKESQ